MNNLKPVTYVEFKIFLDNYKGEITPHCWNEVTLYCDFDRPSEYPIGSGERVEDALIAKSVESFYGQTVVGSYYILDEARMK